VLEPVGREHRVKNAHAGDQAELDGDDEDDPGRAGADEGQPERPACPQHPRREQDRVPPEPRDEPGGQP
jgi:hypothetical protein